jgi:hypothetical protein
VGACVWVVSVNFFPFFTPQTAENSSNYRQNQPLTSNWLVGSGTALEAMASGVYFELAGRGRGRVLGVVPGGSPWFCRACHYPHLWIRDSSLLMQVLCSYRGRTHKRWTKAPEGWRSPGRLRAVLERWASRSVVDCASPRALSRRQPQGLASQKNLCLRAWNDLRPLSYFLS